MGRWWRLGAGVALVCAAVTAACGSGSGGGAARGALIIARGDSIVEYDIRGGDTRPLIAPEPAGAYLLDPAVSADGARIAYVVQPPPVVTDGRYDAGSDLWLAARDGTGARRLVAHTAPNQLIRFPQWTADGSLFAIVQEIEDAGGVSSVAYTLQRIDPATGARTRLRDGVVAYSVASDGKRLVYADRAAAGGETLYIAGMEGGAPAELVPASAQLSPFNSPRFSPDGTKVAFASADQRLAPPAGQRLAAAGPVHGSAAAAVTDGLPEDIWTVDIGGGAPVMVADLKEDLPAVAWGGDGGRLYVLGVNGLYEVNVQTGAQRVIGPGVFHGQMAWAP